MRQINLTEITDMLKTMENKYPKNDIVFIKLYSDGSGEICKSNCEDDFEPETLHQFDDIDNWLKIYYKIS